jgi:hypothetical protein
MKQLTTKENPAHTRSSEPFFAKKADTSLSNQTSRADQSHFSSNYLSPTPKNLIQRQEITIDLEVPTPEQAEQNRRLGVELPTVSRESVDPRRHSAYIDNNFTAVGFSILLNGYALYINDREIPLYIPENVVSLGLNQVSNVDEVIYANRQAAERALPVGPPSPGQGIPVTYYRGAYASAPHLIFPIFFSPATTPRICQTMLEVRRELASQVTRELTVLLMTMVGARLFQGIINRIARWGSRGMAPGASAVRRVRPVNGNINVGGGLEAGSQNASNLNPIVSGTGGATSGIPNHVNAGFEQIAEVFELNSARQIYSNRLPFHTVNWREAARGAYRVMARGGRLHLNIWASESEAAVAARALTNAGFRNVQATGSGAGTIITGIK